jgi:hypothetical protein
VSLHIQYTGWAAWPSMCGTGDSSSDSSRAAAELQSFQKCFHLRISSILWWFWRECAYKLIYICIWLAWRLFWDRCHLLCSHFAMLDGTLRDTEHVPFLCWLVSHKRARNLTMLWFSQVRDSWWNKISFSLEQ